MDTDGPSNDAHGERSGLVGANDGGIRHGFAGTEDTDEGFLTFQRSFSWRKRARAEDSPEQEIVNMWVKVKPFSFAVLRKRVGANAGATRETLTDKGPQCPTAR